MEEILRRDDTLLPWLPSSEEDALKHYAHEPKIFRIDEKKRIADVVLGAEISESEDEGEEVSYLNTAISIIINNSI